MCKNSKLQLLNIFILTHEDGSNFKLDGFTVMRPLLMIFFNCVGPNQTMISLPAHNVLSALRKSVMLRASQHRIFEVRTKIELNSFIVDLYSWRTYTFIVFTYNGCCFKRLNLTQFSFLFCYILNSINVECIEQAISGIHKSYKKWFMYVLIDRIFWVECIGRKML